MHQPLGLFLARLHSRGCFLLLTPLDPQLDGQFTKFVPEIFLMNMLEG